MNDKLFDVIQKLEGLHDLLTSAAPDESIKCDRMAALINTPITELQKIKEEYNNN